MKTVLKLGAIGAVAATAAVLVKRYDLVNRGVALVNTGAEIVAAKAEGFVVKAVGITDDLLTRVAEKLDEQEAAGLMTDDPTADDEASASFGRRTDGTHVGFGNTHDGEGAGMR